MKKILNKTRNSQDRFILISEGMGGHGDPDYYPTHNYSVGNGVDKGNGYQGYMSISYFLKDLRGIMGAEERDSLIKALEELGFQKYLRELGY